MVAFGVGGGEEVVVAAVLEFEFAAQLFHGHGKVSHGQVGLVNARKGLPQLLLVEGRDGRKPERAAGEALDGLFRKEEMGVGGQLPQSEGSEGRRNDPQRQPPPPLPRRGVPDGHKLSMYDWLLEDWLLVLEDRLLVLED